MNAGTMICGAIRNGIDVVEVIYVEATGEYVYDNEGSLNVVDDLPPVKPLNMSAAFEGLTVQLLTGAAFGPDAIGVIFLEGYAVVIKDEYTAVKRSLSSLASGDLESYDIDINTVYTGPDLV